MALPTSGIMTAAMINQELKRASNAPFSLDDPAVRKLAGKLTGTISYEDFYGKSSEVVVVATAGMKGIVAKSLFTPEVWSSDTDKRIVIPTGVEIGPEWGYVFATSPHSDGQAGSFVGTLVLDIQNGAFLSGHGGAANGGEGGNCILANFPGKNGQKLIIRNAGTIRAGGGGGGRGGDGGGGNYSVYTREPSSGQHFTKGSFQYGQNRTYERAGGGDYSESTQQIIVWNGWRMHESSSYLPASPYSPGDGWAYHQAGSYTVQRSNGYQGTYSTGGIVRDKTDWYNTNGGSGGNGGVGQGYGQVSSNGAGGSAGGQNAGAGGTGGAGGGWGSSGNTGANGIAGNRTVGSAGSGGGLAGMAITDPANYTLENTGVVLGRT